MLADTSEIRDFGVALHRQAADLATVAANLTAARMPADAFGSVGARFLTALNTALTQQADHVERLADRVDLAGSDARTAAEAYGTADGAAGQAISR